MFIKKICVAAAFAACSLSASAVDMKVASYTANSITFSLTGKIPSSHPLTNGQPDQLDILYTGSLFSGTGYHDETLSASPLQGISFKSGNTGGFDLPLNYSWMDFSSDLSGAAGTKDFVTLNFTNNYLNTVGTGSFDLYWGNLALGIDAGHTRNMLLSSVKVVNGVVDGTVPEPGSLMLLGIACAGIVASRRRKAA